MLSYCRVTATEPSVVEYVVRECYISESALWTSHTGPIVEVYNTNAFVLASVRPTGLARSPGPVQFQSISTDSEHDAPASGRAESLSVTLLVPTRGGGPMVRTHVVYIQP